jgi:1,4-dihydroxy-6-naphthoate synthase
MLIHLGISPCPNDTFIFDALVNNLIDTGDLQFQVFHEDVQTLNEWALAGKLLVSKISYGVLPSVLDHYNLLASGGALGMGVGPLLIAAKSSVTKSTLQGLRIAIPGENTTAHLLFQFAHPELVQKVFLPFHEIENAILTGEVDAGVIIHENRFTYIQKGLHLVSDLGDFWEKETNCPIPLGGIIVHKSLPIQTQEQIHSLIQRSLRFATGRLPQLSPYIESWAQEMEPAIMRKHIDLYVNQYSVTLGENGMRAVQMLLKQSDHLQTIERKTPMPMIIGAES